MDQRRCMPVVAVLIAALAAEVKVEAAPQGAEIDQARLIYNNKMALIGVLRESARQRAWAEGDFQTLCLILGIGIDVTDRYLAQRDQDDALTKRRNLMASDLKTCRKGLEAGSNRPDQPR